MLFMFPITGNGPDTGAIRSYDVTTKAFTNFVAPGTLSQPWFATFGNTDPATLAYVPAARQRPCRQLRCRCS